MTNPSFLSRRGTELWWQESELFFPLRADLPGQHVEVLSKGEPDPEKSRYHAIPSGETTYWNLFGEAVGKTDASGKYSFYVRASNIGGLLLHEDRLYFGNHDTVNLESVRVDGLDHRIEIAGEYAACLARYGERLVWLSYASGSSSIKQTELTQGPATREVTTRVESIDQWVDGVQASSNAIYWTMGNTIWKLPHGADKKEALLTDGGTYFNSFAVIEGQRHPATLNADDEIVVNGDSDKAYQLLYCPDLQAWQPNVVNQDGRSHLVHASIS